LPQSQLVHRKLDSCAAKQSDPRRFNLDPGQNKVVQGKAKVIHAETRLSAANQPYPPQCKVLRREVNSFATNQGDIAANKGDIAASKVRLRQTS
jgi:hypothetical protein